MDKPRLMVRVREAIRVRHYSLRTEEAYLQWVRRFILFHGKRHPENRGEPEVAAFLTHLAVERNVAAATQNQALAAIVFLYSHVLGHELDWLKNVTRAKRPQRLPVGLTREEVQRVLGMMIGINGLLARLMNALRHALSAVSKTTTARPASHCTAHTTPPLMTGLNSPKGLIYCAPIAPTGALSGGGKPPFNSPKPKRPFGSRKTHPPPRMARSAYAG